MAALGSDEHEGRPTVAVTHCECYTNHADADQNSADNLLLLLAAAGCNYVMGVPCADDVMLNYQSTSYHDAAPVRELFGLRRPRSSPRGWRSGGIFRGGGRLPPGRPALLRQLGGVLPEIAGPPDPRRSTDQKRACRTTSPDDAKTVADDVRTLHRLGYAQELARVPRRVLELRHLAVDHLHPGRRPHVVPRRLLLRRRGGDRHRLAARVPVLAVRGGDDGADRLARSRRPAGCTTGRPILGGRGWGWATAWFNLAGLVTVLAAINVGTFRFAVGAFAPDVDPGPARRSSSLVAVITASQAIVNHLGIRVTRVLTDFSGYWILLVVGRADGRARSRTPRRSTSAGWSRSRTTAGCRRATPVWPRTESLGWLFALGLLLPAYTITGFDASAHVAEETVGAAAERAARHRPVGAGVRACSAG